MLSKALFKNALFTVLCSSRWIQSEMQTSGDDSTEETRSLSSLLQPPYLLEVQLPLARLLSSFVRHFQIHHLLTLRGIDA